MKSSSYRVILVSLLMIFSSLAGCLGGDDEESLEGKYGTVMVSTYHVGELVNAIAGTTVNVEMMSEDNIPVHDYTPSAEDKVRLQGADVFFYHGLGLEPWVDETLESMGEAAPTAMSTHTMPGDEATLDYEGMLISELCELLTAGPYEATTLSMDEDGASEIHAEYVAHTLSFPEMDDDHGEHGDEHDDHDEHNHADHGHASPEETIEDPVGCPADSVISIFHMEEGEYILEFEEAEDLHEFNMAVLKMNGGHAHHDHHGHGDHDEHGDHEDHGDHDEDDMVCYDMSTHTVDATITTEEDCQAAGFMWTAANSGPGGDEDHGDDDHDDHDDHGDDHDDHGEDHGVCYNSDWQMVSGLDNETTCEAYTYMTNVSWGQTTFTGCYNPVSHAADANMSEETCAAFMWMMNTVMTRWLRSWESSWVQTWTMIHY